MRNELEFTEFNIVIDTENAAFYGNPLPEICRILTKLVAQLQNEPPEYSLGGGFLRDINGNRVGEYILKAS